MAAINVEEEWKEAIELLQSTLEEWDNSANDRQKLNAGELEVIDSFLDDIQRFVDGHCHCPNLVHLIEFYHKFERVAMTLYFASLKMKNR